MDTGNINPQLIIISGPNGSGKSTIAPLLLRDTFNIKEYVNADDIAHGLSAFNVENVAFEAGRVMLKRLHTLAKQEATFAFETTLASRTYASWIKKLCCQEYGFHILFIWLQSPELAIQRVKERVSMGGHNIPEPVICRRYYRGIQNFFNLYQPLAETWSVYDNSDYSTPHLMASGEKNKISTIHNSNLWLRFCEAAK